MFERNENEFDLGRTQELGENVTGSIPQQEPQTSGSYYSPRSGGYGAPSGFEPGGNEPPKKKPHKGLKALALFAGVAFIAYASIQCYQYATENPSIRAFLGRQNSEVSEEADARPDSKTESSKASADKNSSKNASSSSQAEPTSFFELAARENAMKIPDIVKKITPATVGVSSTYIIPGQSQTVYNPWSFFGFEQQQTPDQDVNTTGTGIIMRNNHDGSYYIITNSHVVYDTSKYNLGLAKQVQVVLNKDYYKDTDNTELDAEVIGYDPGEDIAVLKVNTDDDLVVAEFGDSDELEVGELVVAIGNPLGFELFGSVTTGIVSALDREVTINDQTMRLIQTDTAINAGNSGGPLINSYGQVIGINSSKMSSNIYSGDSASIEGLCFAIPMTHAQKVINDLINYGYVTGKPQIGFYPADVDESISQRLGLPVGVFVTGIEQGSAAEKAGLKVNDIITAVDDETVSNYEELKAEKDKHEAGDTIVLTVIRNGEELKIPVTLTEKAPVKQDQKNGRENENPEREVN